MHMLGILLFAVILNCEARLFTRCGLVHELRKQGFPENQLRNWVCLIEAESARNTGVVGATINTRSWGLFQINDKYWCSTSNRPGKDCNLKCHDLLSNNITKASICAKIIQKLYDFDAWRGWVRKCKDKPLPDISTCTTANIY